MSQRPNLFLGLPKTPFCTMTIPFVEKLAIIPLFVIGLFLFGTLSVTMTDSPVVFDFVSTCGNICNRMHLPQSDMEQKPVLPPVSTKAFSRAIPVLAAGVSPESSRADCRIFERSLILSRRCGLDTASELVPFLVTGVGRSGTKFLTMALQALNMNVSHDMGLVGKEGVVSWMECFNGNTKFLMSRIDKSLRCRHTVNLADSWRYKHIFHLVRHPLQNIDSRWDAGVIINFQDSTKCQTAVDDGLDKSKMGNQNYTLAFTLRHWVLFNSFAEATSEWGFRNEDLQNKFPQVVNEIRRRVGAGALSETAFNHMRAVSSKTNSHHTRKTGSVSWTWLCEIDPKYCMIAQLMSLRYGYELEIEDLHPRLRNELCSSKINCSMDSLPPKPNCFFNKMRKWECNIPVFDKT